MHNAQRTQLTQVEDIPLALLVAITVIARQTATKRMGESGQQVGSATLNILYKLNFAFL